MKRNLANERRNRIKKEEKNKQDTTQNEDNKKQAWRLYGNKASATIWLEEEEKEVNQGSRVEAEHPLLIDEQFELQQEELFKMVLVQLQLHRQM